MRYEDEATQVGMTQALKEDLWKERRDWIVLDALEVLLAAVMGNVVLLIATTPGPLASLAPKPISFFLSNFSSSRGGFPMRNDSKQARFSTTQLDLLKAAGGL